MTDPLGQRDEATIATLVERLGAWLEGYFRPRVTGLDRLPEGPGLYVGNHNGASLTVDTFIVFKRIFEMGGMKDMPYALGHDVPLRTPLIGRFLRRLGAVHANHENAHHAFEAGHKVLVYPGGDFDSLRPFSERDRIVFGGRTGYIKLALEAGVPIIPVVAAGAQSIFFILNRGGKIARWLRLDRLFRIKVWPLTLSVPWGLTIGPPPVYWPLPTRILIEVLDPIVFERTGEDAAADPDYVRACDEKVRGQMQEALTRLARERRRG